MLRELFLIVPQTVLALEGFWRILLDGKVCGRFPDSPPLVSATRNVQFGPNRSFRLRETWSLIFGLTSLAAPLVAPLVAPSEIVPFFFAPNDGFVYAKRLFLIHSKNVRFVEVLGA